jgi:2-(3-amino-3-carboxypropyl)histidine synthase
MRRFDLEEERVKQEILRYGAKRVLIQLPQGLKQEAPKIAEDIEKSGALPIVSADPCHGACDLAIAEAESLGVDLIIHYGHSKFLKHGRVPTVYVEVRATLSVDEALRKALSLLGKWQKIGLTTTVQHVQALDNARELLIRAGKVVMIGDAGRLIYPGQVIGCDYSNAKSIAKDVDAFLFIGGGKFHALGIALSTSKPTVVADPYENRAFSVNEEAAKIIKQRWAQIEEAKRAKTFAVLIGLKPGQKRLDEALNIKKKIEEAGKAAYILACKEITPEALMDFPAIEVYVNTACPRICLDDALKFQKPMLTLNEARVVIGELSWEELCKKGFLENWT